MTADCEEIRWVDTYRIRYLVDIPEHGVKKGDLGGYIRDEGVLPQDGTGVVLGDAVVVGGTVVGGTVLGDAMVAGGTIHGGTIRHGSIYGGEIYGGVIHGGSIYDGSIYGGTICGGVIRGGEIHKGSVIRGSYIHGGIWRCESLTMHPGKYQMCVCDYNTLKIGCLSYSINYWLANAANVGRIDGMHDAEIELYVSIIDTAKRWHDHVTSRRLLLPQNPH
jgi:hypothetical protein